MNHKPYNGCHCVFLANELNVDFFSVAGCVRVPKERIEVSTKEIMLDVNTETKDKNEGKTILLEGEREGEIPEPRCVQYMHAREAVL